ncbi:MAG: ice-binding family protein [Bacteroidota bacterium]
MKKLHTKQKKHDSNFKKFILVSIFLALLGSFTNLHAQAPYLGYDTGFVFIAGGNIITSDTISATGKIAHQGSISSTIFTDDSIVPNPSSQLTMALNDLDTAMAHIDTMAATAISGTLAGMSLSPGTYKVTGVANLNGVLSLTGVDTDIYVFIITDSLLIYSYGYLNIGAVKPYNIYWRVQNSITLQDSCFFQGILLSGGNINSGLYNHGRLAMLADGNITLQFHFDAPAVAFTYYSTYRMYLLFNMKKWDYNCQNPTISGSSPGLIFFGDQSTFSNVGLGAITSYNSSGGIYNSLCTSCICPMPYIPTPNAFSIDMMAANVQNHYIYFGAFYQTSGVYTIFILGSDNQYVPDVNINFNLPNGGGATCDSKGNFYWITGSGSGAFGADLMRLDYTGGDYLYSYLNTVNYHDYHTHYNSNGGIYWGISDMAYDPVSCTIYTISPPFGTNTNGSMLEISPIDGSVLNCYQNPIINLGLGHNCGALAVGTDFNLYYIDNFGTVYESDLPLPASPCSSPIMPTINNLSLTSGGTIISTISNPPFSQNCDAASFVCYDIEPSLSHNVHHCSDVVDFWPNTHLNGSAFTDVNSTLYFGDGYSISPFTSFYSYTYSPSPGGTTYTATLSSTDCGSSSYNTMATVVFTLYPVMSLSINSTDITCDINSGSACVSVTGGKTDYHYSWSNGATTSCIYNLTAGTYTVTVMDAQNCTASSTITINPDRDCIAKDDRSFQHILAGTISSNTFWTGKIYIDGMINVIGPTTLDITNVDVVFANCDAGITFYSGSKLISHNSVYRPCDPSCGWLGLIFKGSSDNIIDESTFINAITPLNFVTATTNADGKITNNLFNNFEYGIKISNSKFNYPISGNRFLIDPSYPFESCKSFDQAISIQADNTAFYYPISQNYFINGTSNYSTYIDQSGILTNKSYGQFSENTFTDQLYSFFFIYPSAACTIENNQIETLNSQNRYWQIYIDGGPGSVLVFNNSISNSDPVDRGYGAAIIGLGCNLFDVKSNQIKGYNVGIYIGGYATGSQITENMIKDVATTGIYVSNSEDINVSCNVIDNDGYANASSVDEGIIFNTVAGNGSSIYSNCIFNTYIGIDLQTISDVLPDIKNNYVYNYLYAGIYNSGYTGAIGAGTPNPPAQNTLYSNAGASGAVDILSIPFIVACDNWLSVVSASVTLCTSGSEDIYSNASCSNQVYNQPSQSNLYNSPQCDQNQFYYPVVIEGKELKLSPDYVNAFTSLKHDYPQKNLFPIILGIQNDLLSNKDFSLAAEFNQSMNQSSWINDGQKSWVNFYYNLNLNNLILASSILSAIQPLTYEEFDLWNVETINLKLKQGQNNNINSDDYLILSEIASHENTYSNYALVILNSIADAKLPYYVPEFSKLRHSPPGKTIRVDHNLINVYPNPAKDRITVFLVSKEKVTIELEDVTGRVLKTMEYKDIAGEFVMDISGLNTGVYCLKATFSDKSVTTKVLKIK